MLNALGRSVVEYCVKGRWSVIALTLLLTVAAAVFAVRTLKINTDTDALFDSDLPFLVADRAYDTQFPADKDLIVAVIDGPTKLDAVHAAERLTAALVPRTDLFKSVRAPEGGAFFTRNGLLFLSTAELDELSARLAQAQPMLGAVTADRSARGLFGLLTLAFTAAGEGEASAAGLAPVATQVADVINGTLDGKARPVNWAALFSGMTPGGEKPQSFVLAQPRLDTEALEEGGDASSVLRAAAAAQGLTAENGYRVRLTGPVPLSDEEFSTLEQGTKFSGIAAIVFVILLLTAALGAFRLVAVVMAALIMGLILTMGWAAVSVGEINLISVAFAVMFIGIAVDFAIQFVLRYREERRGQGTVEAALGKAGAVMANPLLLAAIATAFGFFAFLPTAYRGVAQLGIIAGGGMVIALILSFTFLPALLTLVRERPASAPVGYQWMAPFNRRLLAHRKRVIGAAIVLAVVALAVLPRLSFDFDPLRLKDPTTESMSTVLDLMGDPWSTPNVLNVLVATPEDAHAMADRLGALPEVREAMTIFSFVPEDQAQKLASLDDLAMLLGPVLQPKESAPLPTHDQIAAAALEARAAAQAFLDGGKAQTPELAPLKDGAKAFVAAVDRLMAAKDQSVLTAISEPLVSGLDGVLTPLRDSLKAQPVTINDLPQDLRESWIAKDGRYRVQVFPKGDGRDVAQLTAFLTAVRAVAPDAAGPPVVIYETGRIVTHAFAVAAVLALISITILLFVILRRPADVGRVMAPLLLAALLTLGTCAATNFPLNFANIIALPLLLGVGVTFPIYLVTAWRDGEELLLTSPAGRGMFYSALTTGSAFGSLMLSRHPGMAGMGQLLTMSLAYTLLATLIFLPALLGRPAHQAQR